MGFFESTEKTDIERVESGVGLEGAKELGGGMKDLVTSELKRGPDMKKGDQAALYKQTEEGLTGAKRGMEMKSAGLARRKGGAGSGMELASQARIGEAMMRAKLQADIGTKLAILDFRESRAMRLASMSTGAYGAVETYRAAGQVKSQTTTSQASGFSMMMDMAGAVGGMMMPLPEG